MANAFDDLPPGLVAAQAAAPAQTVNAPNAFDDITPPAPPLRVQKPPATPADRVQAAEGGILRGVAYTAGLIPDTISNTIDLGKAAIGAGYRGLTGKPIPEALEVSNAPSPVGRWITEQMDKSPITTTQPTRPDDTASRYLATAASVVPAVASGGGSLASIPGTVAKAAVPAVAGQYVAESRPFSGDTANNAAAVLTQALGTAAMPRGRGAPVASQANDAVRAGQEAGLVFPPGTTNPTAGNRLVESIAGKTSVAQHATVENQPVSNEQGRLAMGVKPGDGAPISDVEIAQAKANFAPGYDAMRNAGSITAPQNMAARLATALNQQSGAGRLAPSLRNTQLDNLVSEISANKTFDASDAMDTIAELRDRASQAYRQGDASAGRAYRGVSKVIEDAIDQDLSGRGQGDVVQGFRDSRQGFAAIANVEENRNPTTGNLQAQKLAAALKGGEYLGPDGSPLRVLAESAGQAPKAFAEPVATPGSNHLGFWGSVIGALELGQHLPLEHGSVELAAPLLAYQGARLGARKYALGWGQGGAVQYEPGKIDPRLIAAGLTSAPGTLGSLTPP